MLRSKIGSEIDRRRFVRTVLFGATASMTCGLSWRGLAVANLAPQAVGGPGILRVRLADFPPISTTTDFRSVRLSLNGSISTGTRPAGIVKPLIISREGDDLTVVSAECTHEGCILPAFNANKISTCACHSSRFSSDGSRISGPAGGPLTTFDFTQDVPGELSIQLPELDAFDIQVTQVLSGEVPRIGLSFFAMRNVEYQVLARAALDQPWEPRLFATIETAPLNRESFKGADSELTFYVERSGDLAFLAVAVRLRLS